MVLTEGHFMNTLNKTFVLIGVLLILALGVGAATAQTATPTLPLGTVVQVTLVTGINGTNDNLRLELNGTFPGAPFVQVLDNPGDLQPGDTDTYLFSVTMSFCEMTSFRLLKPATGAVDDDWQLEEIYISIDTAANLFFDRDASVFSPVTAISYPPNGTWNGTQAYQERCSGRNAPIVLIPRQTIPALILPTATPTLPLLVSTPITVITPPSIAQGIPTPVVTCPGFMPSRLAVGGQGRITAGVSNNLRDQPASTGNRLGTIPGGAVITILSGPQCDSVNGIAWWQVNVNGMVGWTAEGQGTVYWIEPVGTGSSTTLSIVTPPSTNGTVSTSSGLQVNRTAVITPDGNQIRVRTAPSLNGGVVVQLTAGTIVVVVGGPTSADGYVWWLIRRTTDSAALGWVAEGANGALWIAPQ